MRWNYNAYFPSIRDASLSSVLEEIVSSQKIPMDASALVFVGRDTRKSSPPLAKAVLDGVNAIAKAKATDYGVVSTPMLHYFVVCHNTNGEYGAPSEEGYYKKLAEAFQKFRGDASSNGNYSPEIFIDGANGVGADKMTALTSYLGDSLKTTVVNDGKQPGDELNAGCGADFVKVSQKSPRGLESSKGSRCASFDGDADRVMYFYNDAETGKFRMLDGDKIATLGRCTSYRKYKSSFLKVLISLVAGYLKELLSSAHIDLNLGLVQTAYANGSSTNYITQNLAVPVACVPTGVKHLHHKALDFDVGVYFEANGHGTVIFSDAAMEKIRSAARTSNSAAAQKLSHLVDVINQTVGDAISDMLLVECILHARGWSVADWVSAYTDLPNRQLKVRVADRTVITTTDAERQVVTPEGLQAKINETVKKFPSGRSFVRYGNNINFLPLLGITLASFFSTGRPARRTWSGSTQSPTLRTTQISWPMK